MATNKRNLFRDHLWIWALLAIGFIVRIVGINFGLPNLYHADEPIIVNHAVAYGTGDLNPHFFKIPPLTSYLLFMVYGFYFLIGRAVGLFENLEDFQVLFVTDPSSFYLIGRIIFGALFGTATVYVFYRLIDRNFSRYHAQLSALFLAFAYLHVRDSHYIYCDIPLLFAIALSFFPIFRILENGMARFYIYFGILLGISVAIKYNGIFILIPFFLAHASRWKINKFLNRNLFYSILFAVISYVICNPFSLIDNRLFFQELFGQSHAEGFTGGLHHLTYSLMGGVGAPLAIVSVFGIFLVLIRRDIKEQIFLAFVIPYYLVLIFFAQPFERYALPILPFFLFFAADCLIKMKKQFKLSQWIFWTISLIFILPSTIKIIRLNQIFLKEDVRSAASKWIEKMIPENSKIAIAYPFSSPKLRIILPQLEQKASEAKSGIQDKRLDLMIQQARRDGKRRYELYFLKESQEADPFLFSKPTVLYNMEHLKAARIQFVIVPKIQRLKEEGFPAQFYKKLQQGKLIARFSPFKNQSLEWPIDHRALTGGPFLWNDLVARERNGHIIEIYQLK